MGTPDGNRERVDARVGHKAGGLCGIGAGSGCVYAVLSAHLTEFGLDPNCGIIINITPLEPEWEGEVTIEISNTTPLPALIYAGEGIGQVLFLRASEVCRTSYADKAGKYMHQEGIVLPRL